MSDERTITEAQERVDTIKALRDFADRLERDPSFTVIARVEWPGGSMLLRASVGPYLAGSSGVAVP